MFSLPLTATWIKLVTTMRSKVPADYHLFITGVAVVLSIFLWTRRYQIFQTVTCTWQVNGLRAVGQRALQDAFRSAGFTDLRWDDESQSMEATGPAGTVTGRPVAARSRNKAAETEEAAQLLLLSGPEVITPPMEAAVERLAESLRQDAGRFG